MANYDVARENLVNLGEMMMRIIYQMNLGWQKFLAYYTGLNVKREQYDEKFQVDNGIGEEINEETEYSEDE